MTERMTDLPGQGDAGDKEWDLCECDSVPLEEELESSFNHLEAVLGGYEDILSREVLDMGSVTGAEQYTLTTLSLHGVSGNEALSDQLKNAAKVVYDTIMATLKKIKDFFTGEGKKSADDAEKRADESLEALAKLDGNGPIPEGAGVLNEDKYMNKVKENAGLAKLFASHPKIKTAYEKLEGSISRIKNSKTIANIGAAYQGAIADTKSAMKTVQSELSTALAEAEKAAKDVQNPKEAKADDPSEIKQSVKEEQKQKTAVAKEKTSAAQLLGSAQTKLTSLLNTISNGISSVGTAKPKSEFKG